ncbi:MAG: AbrB/MazE/SpoVT family DNA-binding domain-containing protein [Nitrosopumilus sp.]|nr:AbrB/MazE/SpoVT family DNA-binding domain-containing protein [Nitrosopumilus sp.]
MTENQTTVRNIWKEGGKTYCISIPIDIVKKLDLDENSTLLVELVDDLIVLKKHVVHLTKTEISKIKDFKVTSNNNESDSTQQIKDDSPNPLDGYEF